MRIKAHNRNHKFSMSVLAEGTANSLGSLPNLRPYSLEVFSSFLSEIDSTDDICIVWTSRRIALSCLYYSEETLKTGDTSLYSVFRDRPLDLRLGPVASLTSFSTNS